MRNSMAAWLAWSLYAIVCTLAAVGLTLIFAGPTAPRGAAVLTKTVLEAFIPVVFGMVGALIVARQTRNTIGWLLMLIALGWTLGDIPARYLPYRLAASPEPSTVSLVMLWFVGWSWWVLIGPLLLILVLFPTGRPPTPRWRWVIIAVGVLFGTFLTVLTLTETISAPEYNVRFPNPLGVISEHVFTLFFGVPWTIMLLTTVSFCVAAVVVRYRRAAAQERAQIKWFFYACSMFLIIYVMTALLVDNTNTQFDVWGSIVFDLALLTIPLSIGIAILRYRLYDIDLIIRRTLIYGLLTTILALIYVGSVVVLQQLLRIATGSTSQLAIVASTLTMAALAQPLRRRIQHVIDRRFYRRRYDAQQTIVAFGKRLRDETDVQLITADLLGVVQETLQPQQVSVWLKQKP